MALLSLQALNDRIIEIESTAAKNVVRASKVLRDLQALIEEVQIETHRLGEAILMLEGATQSLTCLGTAHDERFNRLHTKIEEVSTEARQHTDKTVHDLEMDVGSVASDLADLRGELTG